MHKALEDFDIDKEFDTELDYCNYIERNIEQFAEDVLDSKYISHKKQPRLIKGHKSHRSPRSDFVVNTTTGKHIVEVKNPTSVYHELISSIGQTLGYSIIDNRNNIVLVSYKFIPQLFEIINKFKLPITLALVRKNEVATWSSND